MALKRPPYSKVMTDRSRDSRNHCQSWWVLIGADAWRVARGWADPSRPHRIFALCPPGADPNALDWSAYRAAPVPVALYRCGRVDGGQMQVLVRAILGAGAPRIYDLVADTVFERG